MDATRQDRLSAIAQCVEDTAWASDRTFFKQHPQRKFRIRPAWDIEIDEFALAHSTTPPLLPPTECWWIVVHQVAPGLRARIPFTASHQLPTEAPEKDARRFWKILCPLEWQEGLKKVKASCAQEVRRER